MRMRGPGSVLQKPSSSRPLLEICDQARLTVLGFAALWLGAAQDNPTSTLASMAHVNAMSRWTQGFA